MEHFLICTNPRCRYIVDLREGAQVLERSNLIIAECPECGLPWSSLCPFCGRQFEAIRRGNLSYCSHCGKELAPVADVDSKAP
jgi:ribosomal protein L37AE/L43A